MKKSFILHNDSLDILSDLTDEQAGKLFKAIADYNSGREIELDQITKMIFLPFKNQFIRDGIKFEEMVQRQREKGLKSAAAKKNKQKPTKSTAVNHSQPQSTEPTYNDSDSKNDNKNIVRKCLFKDSDLFIKHNFKEAFPDWSKEKLAYYYEQVLTWSNEGNKKIDWKATVRTWANRDEKQGKIKFDVQPTHVPLSGII